MANFFRKLASAFWEVVNFVRGQRPARPPLQSNKPHAVGRRLDDAYRRGGLNEARLEAARTVLEAELRRVVGIQAPFIRYRAADASWVYRALTPAIPKAPPRRLSGKLQSRLRVSRRGVVLTISDDAKSRKGFAYPLHHEGKGGVGLHPYMRITVSRMRRRLEGIAGVKLRFDYAI